MNASIEMSQDTTTLLRELRDRDSQTGLFTASRLYQILLGEIARSDRYGNPLSCVLLEVRGLDPDRENTRFQIANRVAVVMRITDFAGKWRDDEYLLVLPETEEAGARRFADKVREELVELCSRLDDDGPPDILTRVTAWRSGDDAAAMLERLDTGAPPG